MDQTRKRRPSSALLLAALALTSAGAATLAQNPPATAASVTGATSTTATLGYGFNLAGVSLAQQAEGNGRVQNVVDLKVRYLYAPGLPAARMPDVNAVRDTLLNSLRNYPDKSAYWEVLVDTAADAVFRKYTAMGSLELELGVRPSRNEPFLRVGTATRRR